MATTVPSNDTLFERSRTVNVALGLKTQPVTTKKNNDCVTYLMGSTSYPAALLDTLVGPGNIDFILRM
jgi:hypothetical protein